MRNYKVIRGDLYRNVFVEFEVKDVPNQITLLEAICIFGGSSNLMETELKKARIKYA